MSSDLLAVDQVLLATDADDGARRAAALSLVFANAAARAQANQAVGAESANPKSWGESFMRGCLGQLGQLGWRITDAGHATLTQQTSSFGATATTLAAVLAGGGASRTAVQVVDTIKSFAGNPAEPSQTALLSFWWTNVADVAGWLLCGLGGITGSVDAPSLSLDFVQLDLTNLHKPSGILISGAPFQPAAVEDLFVDVAADSITVAIRRSVTANLDNAVFSARRPVVESRLGDKFADHYRLSSGGQLEP